MSKRSFGVIIIGLLAIAGLGLSGYMFLKSELLPAEDGEDTVIKNIWYAEKLGSTYFVELTITEIPNLNVTATINAGEFLYISFNAFMRELLLFRFVHILQILRIHLEI